ncbi:hypothetical protein [Agromyces lapidis]|uniref:Uncharacterized protein n=1 Tax=Agromyces lapidis TaxID=279574 RepID=A0ABV5SV87_9MICO|nr:hypothetical protein [Agromyces lapidis]
MGADDSQGSRSAIEDWWPKLSINSKHRILEDLEAPIHAEVAAEIERLTVGPAPDLLSPAERRFVLTQIEPVD